MKKNIDNWEVVYFALLLGAVAFLLTGCTQTTRIKGIDAISPVGVEITCDFTLK